MVTPADATDPVSASGSASQLPGGDFLTATTQTARRTLLQFVRTPQLLVMPPILAALFMIIFRYVFGGAINPGDDLDYVEFPISGFLAQSFLRNEMNIPAGIAEDSTSGVYDRLRSLPIPHVAVMAGRSLADTLLNSGSSRSSAHAPAPN
jgi:ABC-2 type transport system permease protein